MKGVAYLLFVFPAAFALPAAPLAAGRVSGEGISTYVGLNKSICKRIVSRGKSRDRREPALWQCGRLVDGWRVILDNTDARAPIGLRRNGVETTLNLYDATGGTNGVLGKRFEFRMRSGKAIGAIVPWAANSASPAVLVVTRLTPTPCVIGVLPPGPEQSASAHALADASADKPCLAKP